MRAMVVSFFTFNLWQDWVSYIFSKTILDYEPGIHYPQVQMQSGTTGLTLLEFIAQKNSEDHDPDGILYKTMAA
jgi:deoxyribodipyrimidine photo-lyase